MVMLLTLPMLRSIGNVRSITMMVIEAVLKHRQIP
jgi:hypothetical protein